MHHHDQDLISEYAGGTLADDGKARRLVESCTQCAATYRSHRVVIESLGRLGPATLTGDETAALHRDLWTELRRSKASSRPGRRRSWSLAYGGVAFIFMAVAVVGVINQMGATDTGTTAVFSEIGRGLSGQGVSPDAEDASGDGDEELGAPDDAESPSVPFSAIARRLRLEEPRVAPSFAYQDAEDCVEKAGLDNVVVVPEYEDLTETIVVVPEGADLATAQVTFVDPESCEVVHVED